MKLTLGIDTGGTCTDAVLYESATGKVIASAKSATTHHELSVGILAALDKMDKKYMPDVELVALSTTLATNACVEGKGGRAHLVFFGGDRKIVDKTGASYGLPPTGEISFCDGKVDSDGEVVTECNPEAFDADVRTWKDQVEAAAVVQNGGVYNPVFEKLAKERLMKLGVPTVCGYELFSDRNYIKRGASTLLNARLIPVLRDFMTAIGASMQERGIHAPVVIVRSDGTVMKAATAEERPVETLLCGPAASVAGGMALTGEKNCLIVDMGGTTTDVAIVRNGEALHTRGGVNIGKWRTFVKSVFIDTFGLGGDSRVLVADEAGKAALDDRRAVPLAVLGSSYPGICDSLRRIYQEKRKTPYPLYEYYVLVRGIGDDKYYSAEEHAITEALKDGPLNQAELAEKSGISPYSMKLNRLIDHGIILRAGLTPTDIMHVRGDFEGYSREAAELGVQCASLRFKCDTETLCDRVYDAVCEKLYKNLVRVLLTYDAPEDTVVGDETRKLIDLMWRVRTGEKDAMTDICPKTQFTLVGIGAPTHVFLPRVAKLLETRCVIPEHAGVANAVGAVVGNVAVRAEVHVKPDNSAAGITGYTLLTPDGDLERFDIDCEDENGEMMALDRALARAEEVARAIAVREARGRGANGEIAVACETLVDEASFSTDYDANMHIHLETIVAATAAGRAD